VLIDRNGKVDQSGWKPLAMENKNRLVVYDWHCYWHWHWHWYWGMGTTRVPFHNSLADSRRISHVWCAICPTCVHFISALYFTFESIPSESGTNG